MALGIMKMHGALFIDQGNAPPRVTLPQKDKPAGAKKFGMVADR